MTFKKKVKYENMYNWAGADQGSCFYCKEENDLAFSFFAGVQRGICPDCLHRLYPEFANELDEPESPGPKPPQG